MTAPICAHAHCGGRLWSDVEDAHDAPVLKCMSCSRPALPPRPHEEPERYRSKRHEIPGMGEYLSSDRYLEGRRKYARGRYHEKKAGA